MRHGGSEYGLADGPSPDLSRLGFRLFQPSTDLSAYVRHFWVVDCELERPTTQHVYPDGGIGIVFDLQPGTQINARTPSEPCFFDGIHSAVGRMGFSKRSLAMGVRFLPGGAARLLSAAIHEIGNEPVPLRDVGLAGLERTFEQLCHRTTLAARLETIETWLRAALHARAARHEDISPAVRHIARHPTRSVGQLAGELGLSARQLERLFRAQLGMPAKKLARLHRIGMARDLVKTRRDLSLTDIGLIAGYYDQAHFIKDFRSVSGMTPGEYQRRQHAP